MDTTDKTFRAGLIGQGIQASLTPAMHMAEGAAQGLSYDYELIDLALIDGGADRLAALLEQAEQRGLGGLNITYPCKQQIMPLLDSLSDEALKLGAVNTVVLQDGKRHGHNTDWWGFAEGFRRALPDADLTSVVQLGAGGAGSATAFAMLKLGAGRLTIVDQDPVRARTLADSMAPLFPEAAVTAGADTAGAIAAATGLVHATPTGMAKHPGLPLDAALLRPDLWIAEIVYFPLETELLRVARKLGCRTVNGGGMAVFQAVRAFQLFTGLTPDADRMRAHFSRMTAGEVGETGEKGAA
ncbi:shikimate dehydrogenase [Rhizobium halophytocola]|uniref:Shikimate dehydrogenase (NADP(+)) n=1 Tax=Rhizobium halophytocola TaxID=735519 RepID=A0ABS4E4W4_9HYPH|nr:shikimate dehydrogenase [Rhizobium halophytocola]MBP1852967.1 shikimate dehydrogenase [Rhizobium halophytocola]